MQSQPRVTGFLGGKGKPVPITQAEAERLIRQMDEGVERPRTTISFDIGEEVRVIEGPFESFNGIVEEADDEKELILGDGLVTGGLVSDDPPPPPPPHEATNKIVISMLEIFFMELPFNNF